MIDIIQGSPEWFAIRLGKVTASRVADVIAKTKSGASASRANYFAELVAERLTGQTQTKFTSDAMQWGTDNEAAARNAYAFFEDQDVTKVGFVAHPGIDDAGASPDGLVGDAGLVEIKCPNTATHIDTLLNSTIPTKYITQMQWQMACTGRLWCDFVSFDPRLPDAMQLYVERVDRCEQTIASLETEVRAFLREVSGTVAALQSKFMNKEAA